MRTLTLNRFKSQTNDTFELLGYNYSHKQRFVTLKIVGRHSFAFYIQFQNSFIMIAVLDTHYERYRH